GLPIYAETGGLMYCARSLRTSDGTAHQMANIIPVDIALEAGTLRTGYRDLRLASTSMLGPEGTRLRGHEFHFSRVLSGSDALSPLYSMHDCDGEPLGFEGWVGDNLAASFINLHFGQHPAIATRLVTAARNRAGSRRSLPEPLE